jgi:hypothetical protein
MAGPVPKRTDTRRRTNKPEGVQVVKAPSGAVIVWPAADPTWHAIATSWYEAVQQSGQAQFYEQSDVATAFYVAEAIHRNLDNSRFSAQLFASVMSAMTDLLVTEGARRRARIELERGAVLAPVTPIKNYRAKAQ